MRGRPDFGGRERRAASRARGFTEGELEACGLERGGPWLVCAIVIGDVENIWNIFLREHQVDGTLNAFDGEVNFLV